MTTKEFLNSCHIDYRVYPHTKTYDAQHLAESLHISGHDIAKTVLIHTSGGPQYFVLILPASERINFRRLSEFLDWCDVRLATEQEIAERCPDDELGVLTPFGSNHGLKTLIDKSLTQHEDLFFQGDSHEEAIRLKYTDFFQLEHPLVVSVTERHCVA